MLEELELHHFALKIRPGSLEKAIEFFEEMGMKLSYREGDVRWALVEFVSKKIEIQLIEVEEKTLKIEEKLATHVAFLTKNPQVEIKELEKWSKQSDVKLEFGGWGKEMLWFDAPDIFVNFVVEVMGYSVVGRDI